MLKPLAWIRGSLARTRAFPPAARRQAGYQLFRVQSGLEPTDWKPMRSVGPGVIEVRIHEQGEFRVLLIARFAEAIYVLHGFEKKTRKTRDADLELARRNFAALDRHRRGV